LAALGALLGGNPAAAQALPAPGIAQPAPAVPPTPGSPGAQSIPAARWTAEQVRQSFEQADANSDGQLTRAEAQRLSILPRSFEEMDENKNGILERTEYEATFGR
jgi:hypothetical protein